MRYSMWSEYLPGTSPEQCVKDFSKKGWHYLELSTEHGENLILRGNSGHEEKTGLAFSRYAKDYGVSFPQGHLWIASDIAAVKQEEALDLIKRWLDLFCAAGVNACVLHYGGR